MTMCQPSYGFLPCTTTVLGNLFLVLTYGFLVYKGARYLSDGSELLLETLGPGLVGGLLLPILGALPEALIVLASGLSGSGDKALNQVEMGMGLLAGSTVFLLTLLWGTCVVVGKCDLAGPNRAAVDSQNTKGFSLTGTGVSTDSRTTYLARIMAISVVPFIIAGFPNITKATHYQQQRPAILLALIVSFLLVLSYCLYQVSNPWIQKRRLAYVKHKLVIAGILRHAQMQALGRLINDDGTPNEEVIRKLFRKIDMDESGSLSRAELHALIVGINFEEVDFDRADAVDRIMGDFDKSRNDTLEEKEFVDAMKEWINKAQSTKPASGAFVSNFIHDFHARARLEYDQLVGSPDEDEVDESTEDPEGWGIAKAVGLVLLGTAMAAAFADPLVDAVQNISKATRIPPFLISFVVLPLATNSIGEPVSSVICISNKKERTASLTFSELYSGVTMKNTLCLGVFLSLIYVRNLTWEYSSEVLMVLVVCVVMGLLTSFRRTYPLWTCLVAYALYPMSLVVVYVLDHIFDWS